MEQENTEELLNKYFEGQTSEKEELILKKWLGNPPVQVTSFEECGYIAIPPAEIPEPSPGFESRLEEITHVTADISPAPARRRWLTLAGTAAAIAAAVWIMSALLREPKGKDTFTDPALAMAEVRSVLLDISEKMNTGTSNLMGVADIADRPDELDELSTINRVIGENLSRLRHLGDLVPDQNETETN